MTAHHLVADIGGTNIRLGLSTGPGAPIEAIRRFETQEFERVELAFQHYFDLVQAPVPRFACLSVAGAIVEGRIQFTNSHWAIDEIETAKAVGFEHLLLINDFSALAMSLPSLAPNDLHPLFEPKSKHEHQVQAWAPKVRAVLGPGTGLGVSSSIELEGQLVALKSEGGHIGFAPQDACEEFVHAYCAKLYGRVSAERILCGAGIRVLLQALAAYHGDNPDSYASISAKRIVQRGLHEQTGLYRETVTRFCSILGAFAGDITLVVGATDGVYLAGGIAQGLSDFLPQSPFMQQFLNKGRLRPHIENNPIYVITTETTPALRGCLNALHAFHKEI